MQDVFSFVCLVGEISDQIVVAFLKLLRLLHYHLLQPQQCRYTPFRNVTFEICA